MRRAILLLCILWLVIPLSPVNAYDLLIVKSQHSQVYDEVLKGIRSVRKFSERVITLSDYSEIDIKRIVREDRPSVIVSLGDLALEVVRKVNQVPVVPLMAASYRQNPDRPDHLNGIEVFIAPERYLALFRQMKVQRVGVIYSKGKTGAYVRQAQRSAAKYGITLVSREVASPKEVFLQLDSLKGAIDALWMLPDSIVVSQMTVEGGFTNFSMDQNVPLVSFTGAYLAHGAAVAVDIDRLDLGQQAGEMIVDTLGGGLPSSVSTPRKAVLLFNHSILKRLGFTAEQVIKMQRSWE